MPCRLLRVGLVASVIVSSALLPAFAEERANRFAVSDEQVRALGVELVTLAAQLDSAGVRFPAQVVLPPQSRTGGERAGCRPGQSGFGAGEPKCHTGNAVAGVEQP